MLGQASPQPALAENVSSCPEQGESLASEMEVRRLKKARNPRLLRLEAEGEKDRSPGQLSTCGIGQGGKEN